MYVLLLTRTNSFDSLRKLCTYMYRVYGEDKWKVPPEEDPEKEEEAEAQRIRFPLHNRNYVERRHSSSL